jgi:hypothetical protein
LQKAEKTDLQTPVSDWSFHEKQTGSQKSIVLLLDRELDRGASSCSKYLGAKKNIGLNTNNKEVLFILAVPKKASDGDEGQERPNRVACAG